MAIIGKVADEPAREHGGIQCIGKVHQIEIMMLGGGGGVGWCYFKVFFVQDSFLDCILFTNQQKKEPLQVWSILRYYKATY